MTRDYAAVQLLKHGPLTLEQFRWITCWTELGECKTVLDRLKKCGRVKAHSHAGRILYHAVKLKTEDV